MYDPPRDPDDRRDYESAPRYFTKEIAEKAVADLRRGETEGWRYEVVPPSQFHGWHTIAVYDETGRFIALW